MKKFTQIKESKKEINSELEMGIKIESEHLDVYEELEQWLKSTFKDYSKMPWPKEEFYKKIAQAHIKELPDYYTRLAKMEKE